MTDTPEKRKRTALADIVGLNAEIKHLQDRLTSARAMRRAARAKYDRAQAAIRRRYSAWISNEDTL